MKTTMLITSLLLSSLAHAHIQKNTLLNKTTAIYADLDLLKKSNAPILYSDSEINVGYAVVNDSTLEILSNLSHQHGRCGNFEALPEVPQDINIVKKSFNSLVSMNNKNKAYEIVAKNLIVGPNENIKNSLTELNAENIKSTVAWLSSYPTRYNKGTAANTHVNDFFEKIKTLTATAKYPVQVDLISHKSTPQKSIRVSITGLTKPSEYVIFGGHLDSINGWNGQGKAPGADDNASGSASLFEALRVLLTKEQPQRTIEFFWYAGEESGLLGSAEIAETYKVEKRNVISVLQLDMTMFPGDGANKITSISDFTSPWLRDYLKVLNTNYLNIEILDDKCGYGCSDHASWYRRGFPTLMPTEAKFNSMFGSIHTDKDVISNVMSFEHSLIFSKIALAMALDLGNSNQKESLY